MTAFLFCCVAITLVLVSAKKEAPQAFSLLPSCDFAWGSIFVGYAIDVDTGNGVAYSDAEKVCGFYTNSGNTPGAMIPAITTGNYDPYSILKVCYGFLTGGGNAWVSSSDPVNCYQAAFTATDVPFVYITVTVNPIPCSGPLSAVLCYFPTAVISVLSTSIISTTVTDTTSTRIFFVPSLESTTITQLTTSVTLSTRTSSQAISNTFIFTVKTDLSVSTATSPTTETTTVRSTVTFVDTESITTTFSYNDLSITVLVPTETQTTLTTDTLTICDQGSGTQGDVCAIFKGKPVAGDKEIPLTSLSSK